MRRTQHADVQVVVDGLAAAVGQSVLVEDLDQHPVWWSTHGDVDPTRRRTILDRRVDPSAAAVVDRFGLRRATAPVRTPAVPEADMWARWCVPVRFGDRLLGLLWVLDPDEAIGDGAMPALLECARVAARAMAGDEPAEEQRLQLRAELVDRLLAGPDDDAARELARLERVPHTALVQVEAPARAGGWPVPGDLSVHVASGDRTATSGTPLPLVELGEAARRAVATRRAIAAGARPDPTSWDGLGAWLLVVEVPERVTVAQVHPGAEVPAAQPRGDLMSTARVVLDHGGDVATAAQELHVHRTTLYYRLDRIRELTGVDLRDGHARTDLQLALWLAAYRAVQA